MLSVNNSTSGAEAHLPFGGNGKSGNGSRLSGIWVLDQFTRWQSMNWDYAGKLQKAQMDIADLPADLDYTLPEARQRRLMYDVIVAGLGGMGSAAAYHLAGRGKRVLGLERYSPAHDRGSSHGQSRIIRLAYSEGSRLRTAAPAGLRAVGAAGEGDGRGSDDAHGRAHDRASRQQVLRGQQGERREYDLPYEVLDAAELKRRYPVFEPDP